MVDNRDNAAAWGFDPGTINVPVGGTVTWVNVGLNPHSATATNGGFDTDVFDPGTSKSITFNQAGSFDYICKPHPWMHGTIVVAAAGAAPAPGARGSGPGGTSSACTAARARPVAALTRLSSGTAV